MSIVRNQCFDPKSNMTTAFGETLCGYAYDEELVGPQGVHVHIWVPEHTPIKKVQQAYREAKQKWDVVSFSYDYIPEGEPKP